MATRIKYRETAQEGLFQSINKFNHRNNGARYYILIDNKEFKWEVVEERSETVEASGRMNPNRPFAENHMRTDAREALEKLGIEFKSETRTTKKKKKV